MSAAHSPSKTLLGLKVLAQLRTNEKLGLVDGRPQVYKPGYFQWFWRWWDKQGKENVIESAEKWVAEAYDQILQAMEKEEEFANNKDTSSRKKFVARQENLRYIQHRLEALIECKQGIEDMKSTYSDDATSVRRLDLLLTSIDDKVDLVQKSMEYLGCKVVCPT